MSSSVPAAAAIESEAAAAAMEFAATVAAKGSAATTTTESAANTNTTVSPSLRKITFQKLDYGQILAVGMDRGTCNSATTSQCFPTGLFVGDRPESHATTL